VAQEEKAFQNLLCAIFGKEFSITDAAELNAMTTQADYYGALCILSNQISATSFNSPGLVSSIGKDPCSLLVSACKLRHKLLFRECFIYVLGPWSTLQYAQLSNPVLLNLAIEKHASMKSRIFAAFEGIVQVAAGSAGVSQGIAAKMLNMAQGCLDVHKKVLYPKFFRLCCEKYADYESYRPLFSSLLANKLVLNKDAIAGAGAFADFFLCSEVEDHELPWDVTQTDW
jgi:hypothetical protein